jgi:hypothetical protein
MFLAEAQRRQERGGFLAVSQNPELILPFLCEPREKCLKVLTASSAAARANASLHLVLACGLRLCAFGDITEFALYVFEGWYRTGCRMVERMTHCRDMFG